MRIIKLVEIKTIFSIIITILTFGCQEHEQLNTHYEILSGACGTLTFKDKIGNDINSASDSLEILQQELLTGGCPGNPCHNYNIEKRIIEVNFNKDRRDFYGFIFKDSTNNLSLFAMSDVLDTEGNYYFISWCSD